MTEDKATNAAAPPCHGDERTTSSDRQSTTTISQLYAFGSNGSGQLGIGHFEDCSSPHACQFIYPTREGSNVVHGKYAAIRKIVAGGNHTLVLLADGTVYAAGDDSDGRCGVKWSSASAALAATSSVPDQQRGLQSDERFSKFVQTRVQDALIAPGPDGEGGDEKEDYIVVDVAAAWGASLVVVRGKKRKRSRVYAYGTGYKGELGLGEDCTQAKRPRLVFDASTEADKSGHLHESANEEASCDFRITNISACMNHVVLLTSTGNVYGWGASRKGQLGPDLQTEKIVWAPTKLNIPFKPCQVVTGKDFTFLVSSSGDQLFLGESKYFDLPIRLPNNVCDTSMFAGWSSVQCLNNGRLFGFGRNDRGQLPALDAHRVQLVAVGSEHSLACLDGGDLVAWGWGEHGNCGSPIDAKGNVVGEWNVIQRRDDDTRADAGSVKGLGAGCATSFFWTGVSEQQP